MKIKFMVVALLLAAASGFAQKKEKATGSPSPEKQINASLAAPVKVTTVEGITEYRLANGLKVLMFPDPSKQTITVNITYMVGSKHENYGETGMAHLLEHMLLHATWHSQIVLANNANF